MDTFIQNDIAEAQVIIWARTNVTVKYWLIRFVTLIEREKTVWKSAIKLRLGNFED